MIVLWQSRKYSTEDKHMSTGHSQNFIKHHYHILTSSDNALVPQIAVSITAMAKNLAGDFIDFYLLHSQITPENLQLLSTLCRGYGNIMFHEIQIHKPEIFDPLVQAGNWVRETYFPLCAHQLLPDTIERVLYLDAGDTLVLGDIAPYYFCDFEDNFLIVTGTRYKVENNTYVNFSPDDLTTPGFLPGILKGIFNSGSYVINLRKMREAKIDISYYCRLTELLGKLRAESEAEKFIYFGDQGLLSAAFIGNMKYYGYPEIQNLYYWPYKFCLGYYDHFDHKPDYQPAILHFAGVPFKPWKADYPLWPKRFHTTGGTLQELSKLKPLQLEYYFLWLEYLFLTDQALTTLGL